MLNWQNVRLIFLREIRDQLRDRRSLFMIVVLPLMLYPLLGMTFMQLQQFMRKNTAIIEVVGDSQLSQLKDLSPLFTEEGFNSNLFNDLTSQKLLKVVGDATRKSSSLSSERYAKALTRLDQNKAAVVLYFPPGFSDKIKELRERLKNRSDEDAPPPTALVIPKPQMRHNSSRESSVVANRRVETLLYRWTQKLIQENLTASKVPTLATQPFSIDSQDIAPLEQKSVLIWSKLLPFVMFIWALTGAFYPAVDLCAGEKERGTLETLLSSPAMRQEIVWGKMLTVMCFSTLTSVLNLVCLMFTGRFVISQLQEMPNFDPTALSLPPIAAIGWLLLALIPMSALFSALCLACAAFARSTKEGQYYLMPLLLGTLPLVLMPMSPGVELSLGNSLIPVTGGILLLKSLIEGQYQEVLPYIVPVIGVTSICCLLAIRWAVEQFNQESVLFRESERFDLGRWIVHLVRDRQDTPSLPEAFFAVALIFILRFFMNFVLSAQATPTYQFFFQSTIILQVVCFVFPTLVMALFLSRKPRKTFLLDRWPGFKPLGIALLLAVTLHPFSQLLSLGILYLYPTDPAVAEQLLQVEKLLREVPNKSYIILLMAALPAICEELTFRGLLLSGFRHIGHKWWAIALSAIFFGIIHGVIQQSITATIVGMLLGYIAIQTGSLLPCILYHFVHNSMGLLAAYLFTNYEAFKTDYPMIQQFVKTPNELENFPFSLPVYFVCGFISLWLIYLLHRIPYSRTQEEQLTELREKTDR